jgi:hypothetical protein
MVNNLPTQARLKELFIYDPDSGVFTRRISTGRHDRHKAGKVAGTKGIYWHMHVDGKRFVGHRLAWMYVYGEPPKEDLDHINQNKLDNRIENLREATRRQNMQNVTLHKHNSSGFKGVAWHSLRKKWRAYIFNGYKQTHLGLFETLDQAVQARKAAESQYHTHRLTA